MGPVGRGNKEEEGEKLLGAEEIKKEEEEKKKIMGLSIGKKME